ARPEAAGRPVVLHGFSLGSLAVSMIIAGTPVDGVILQGSGTTVREYARHRIPWYAKPFVRVTVAPKLDPLDNRAWVSQSRAPLLVLVGKKDEAAYWKMSRVLYDASPSANKRFVCLPKGHHNGLEIQPGYDDAVLGLLDSVIDKVPQPAS
ncbi:MAG: alpha/beta hydrolase, partial [Acidobacteriota bacterium]|nr:alpha/beta hydrolase [Acidobacteriota bacterium]